MGLARVTVKCAHCGEDIVAGVDERCYPRRGELVSNSYHRRCYTVAFSDDSQTPATPATATNGDGLAALLAGAIGPYMQIQRDEITDELEARLRSIVDEAVANLPKQVQTVYIQNGETIGTVDGHKHEHYDRLVKLIKLREHVYLWGEAGSGKSTVARQIAKMLGLKFYYLSLQAQMQESRIMGFVSPLNGRYYPSDFYRAWTYGGVFLLDELELGNDNMIGSLNGALANGECAFPLGVDEDGNEMGGLQPMHPDFVCVATGNTPGYGATQAYSARRALDGATRDRFAYLQWDTDKTLEHQLAGQYHANATAWVTWVQNVRELAKTVAQKLTISQRASQKGAKVVAAGFPIDEAAEMFVFRGIDANTKNAILARFPLPEMA